MLVFISGGVRSGKSYLGEKLAADLAGSKRKIYLATSRHYDQEITKRIEVHQLNRAEKGFLTIDKSSDIVEVASSLQREDTVLLDCLGTLLANEMFDCSEQEAKEGLGKVSIAEKIMADISKINHQITNLIVISNEVFSDGVLFEPPIEAYVRSLGELHIKLAKASDTAIECVYSGYHCHKGSIAKEEL